MLNGITSKHNGSSYCLNCFYSFRTENALKEHENVCKNYDCCYVEMPDKDNKRKGSCNTINDPYAKLYVPDTIKNINIKVFNLISRTNKTKYIEWYKTCKWSCRLDASVCNNKQRWNENNCRCECKELIDKGMRDKGFIWNPSNCECECNKLCD